MARKVHVDLLDDIDGSQADETVKFGLDGTNYEIDVNAKHAEKLRGAVAKYILKARRLGRNHIVSSGRGQTGSSAKSDRAQNQAVRDWAKTKGIEISDRGRIPRNIVEQYQATAGR